MAIVITQGLILGDIAERPPLTHARIGHKTITRTGTIVASGSAVGYPASAAASSLTYSYWMPDAMPATWEVQTASAQTVNYLGIAAHTLSGTTVFFEYHDGADWVEITEFMPGDNSPVMVLCEDTVASRFRIRLAGDTTPRVGVIYIGEALEMQRAIYGGHTPITLARETVTRSTVSERGQFLGRSIIRAGSKGSWAWQHLSADWYREHFDPFVEDARLYPFFIAWRPATFPDEVAYCWTGKDIRPSNMGVRDLMEVSLEAEGLGVD